MNDGDEHADLHFRGHLRTLHHGNRGRHDPPGSKAVMAHTALASDNASSIWLSGLIEATEAIATSAQPCDPATVKAFTHRLQMRPAAAPVLELAR